MSDFCGINGRKEIGCSISTRTLDTSATRLLFHVSRPVATKRLRWNGKQLVAHSSTWPISRDQAKFASLLWHDLCYTGRRKWARQTQFAISLFRFSCCCRLSCILSIGLGQQQEKVSCLMGKHWEARKLNREQTATCCCCGRLHLKLLIANHFCFCFRFHLDFCIANLRYLSERATGVIGFVHNYREHSKPTTGATASVPSARRKTSAQLAGADWSTSYLEKKYLSWAA